MKCLIVACRIYFGWPTGKRKKKAKNGREKKWEAVGPIANTKIGGRRGGKKGNAVEKPGKQGKRKSRRKNKNKNFQRHEVLGLLT